MQGLPARGPPFQPHQLCPLTPGAPTFRVAVRSPLGPRSRVWACRVGAQPVLTFTLPRFCCRSNTRCGPRSLCGADRRSALQKASWGLAPQCPPGSPPHKDVAYAATEVKGVRLRQASQEETRGPLRLRLGLWAWSPVGLHLLELVVDIEPDPGGREAGGSEETEVRASAGGCPSRPSYEGPAARLTLWHCCRRRRNGGRHRRRPPQLSLQFSGAVGSRGPAAGTPGMAHPGDSSQVSWPVWGPRLIPATPVPTAPTAAAGWGVGTGVRSHRGCPVVEQGTVLGTVEAKAGVDVASEGRHVRERQVKEAVAVESHGAPHLRGGRP